MDKRYSGDNRLIPPKSLYRRRCLAPRCRLISSWGCSRSQGYGCSPFKEVRELGLKRRETVWSLSSVGAADKWKLFKGLTPNPTTTVDTSNTSFTIATLVAYLESGAFTTNSSSVSITANSTVNVSITANTLLLDTALYANSGGTGYKTYSLGDILVGNSTAGIQTLSVGVSGKVLQSNGTTLVYDDLDGGGF